MTRYINRVVKDEGLRKSKPIKYESILRVIEIAEDSWDSHPEIKEESEGKLFDNLELREKIFSMILFSEEDIQKIGDLIKRIHQFNLKTRCFGIKKRKIYKVKEKDESSQKNFDNGL